MHVVAAPLSRTHAVGVRTVFELGDAERLVPAAIPRYRPGRVIPACGRRDQPVGAAECARMSRTPASGRPRSPAMSSHARQSPQRSQESLAQIGPPSSRPAGRSRHFSIRRRERRARPRSRPVIDRAEPQRPRTLCLARGGRDTPGQPDRPSADPDVQPVRRSKRPDRAGDPPICSLTSPGGRDGTGRPAWRPAITLSALSIFT
jgi:hypothetical protein